MNPSASRIDERASDWVEGTLSGPERERFERELEADPELAREIKDFERVVGALRALPPAEAPPDFLRAVQHRIRRRSRGRYFGRRELTRVRFPYEAVINGILLGLLMAVYIIAMPPADGTPVPLAPALVARAEAPAAVRTVLEGFGTVAVAPTGSDAAVVFTLAVAADRIEALRAELARFPEVRLSEAGAADPSRRQLSVTVPVR